MVLKIKNKLAQYFGPTVEIRVQIFFLLAFVGMASGIVVGALALFLKENIVTAGIDFALALLSFILFRIAKKKKNYHFCSWVFVVVGFLVFYPLLFFSGGGYKSGATHSFVVAFIFTAFLMGKYERIAAIAIEFVVYMSCIIIVFYRPETAYVLPSEFDYMFVNTINLTTNCAMLLFALLMRARMFGNRHDHVAELNRELEARNETLAHYDTMKSDFLATVAHEINTPLAIISASSSDTAYLLKERPLKMDEINENLSLIKQRVKMIDSILLDLMDTVAIENGRVSLNRQPVSLHDHLKNICDAQFKLLDKNGNCIKYEMEPDLQDVWVDPSRLEQVMTNLLSNAVRFTKEGIIKVMLERSDNKQIVGVVDNGEGMEPEMARTALKQYVSTRADYWRHGIGLYICRRIMAAHGGEIWIDSEKGRGTSVFFSLAEGAEYE